MTKKFYIFAWVFLIGAALASVFRGTFDAMSMLTVGIGAVGLVYAFALWAVFTSPAGVPSR